MSVSVKVLEHAGEPTSIFLRTSFSLLWQAWRFCSDLSSFCFCSSTSFSTWLFWKHACNERRVC